MNYQPSGLIPGGCALLILAIVFLTAVTVRVYDAAANYMETPANSNSNSAPISNQQRQQPTPARMSNDGDSGSSTPPPTATPTPTATTDYSNANKVANSAANSPAQTSRYNWRVTSPAELRDSPSDYGNSIETLVIGDGLIMIERKSESSKWYKVTTENNNTGWIDGNFIEEIMSN